LPKNKKYALLNKPTILNFKSKMDNNPSLMHNFNTTSSNLFSRKFFLVLGVTIFIGIGSGFILARIAPNGLRNNALPSPKEKNAVEKGKTYGSNDTNTFKDSTEGTLKEGGIDGEGQFHLERPGGISQNVYLTSSLVDLSLFINRKIKVWGETQTAQKAGWFMDVGRVEVLE
jgi:hypothetical protein